MGVFLAMCSASLVSKDCCAHAVSMNETAWCSSGLSANFTLASVVADECNVELPWCYVSNARFESVDNLRRMIPWKEGLESFDEWFETAERTLTEDVQYTNGAIGTFVGYEEVVEYLLIFNPGINGDEFMLSELDLVNVVNFTDNVMLADFSFKAAVLSYGQRLETAPVIEAPFNITFETQPGYQHMIKEWTIVGWPDYDFFSNELTTPAMLCSSVLAYCPNDLYPYKSFEECENHISRLPEKCAMGGEGIFFGDTFYCRVLHWQISLIDPITHCPHISSASEKCRPEYCSIYDPPFGHDHDARGFLYPPLLKGAHVIFVLVPAGLALLFFIFGLCKWRKPSRTVRRKVDVVDKADDRIRLSTAGEDDEDLSQIHQNFTPDTLTPGAAEQDWTTRSSRSILSRLTSAQRISYSSAKDGHDHPPMMRSLPRHVDMTKHRSVSLSPQNQHAPVLPPQSRNSISSQASGSSIELEAHPTPFLREKFSSSACPLSLGGPAEMTQVSLAFQGLSCYTHKNAMSMIGSTRRQLLTRVEGEFLAGSLNGILGPSGCGKTTLMRVLLGREAAFGMKAEGSIRILDVGLNVERSRQWGAKRTQFVGSTSFLSPLLTVEETMEYYARAMLDPIADLSGDDLCTHIVAVLGQVGLSSAAHLATRVFRLSDGEQRRISLAVQLLSVPSVCLLDEPTSGQDSSTALFLVNILRNLASQGFTLVASIHQPSPDLFQHFDNVIFLRRGGLMGYRGSPTELKAAVAAKFPRHRDEFLANFVLDNIDDVHEQCYYPLEPLASSSARRRRRKGAPSTSIDTLQQWHGRLLLPVQRLLRLTALGLARFAYGTPISQVVGYQLTVTLLAFFLSTMFRDLPLKDNADGGQYLYVLFIGMNFLCGVSNFQFNALVQPVEFRRFLDEHATGFAHLAEFLLSTTLRDHLIVSVGSSTFIAITYFVCDLGSTTRFWPIAGTFLLAQHAFHATGAAFFCLCSGNPTPGLVLSGCFNFLVFLFAGLVISVKDMPPVYRALSWVMPSYPSMGLMSYFLFADRRLDCDPLDSPEVCLDGDHLLGFFDFLRFQHKIVLSLVVVLANTLVARIVTCIVLARSTAIKPDETLVAVGSLHDYDDNPTGEEGKDSSSL